MPSPDALPKAPSIDALRARLSSLPGDAAVDHADFRRLTHQAMDADHTGVVRVPSTELRVRMSGAGVHGHHVAVHDATQLLSLLQGAITAFGSSVRKQGEAKAPKNRAGKRLGVREATELRLGPEIEPGSVVFTLQSPADLVPETKDGLEGSSETDSLVDLAARRLMDLVTSAQADDASDVGVLADDMRRYGALVASKLSKIAEHALVSEIELDLRHWSRAGRRRESRLGSRGAAALRAAAERNRERTETDTVTGRLRTVSDGADQLRMTLDDGTSLRIAVDPEHGLELGPLLGKRVEVDIDILVRWQLATGRETRSRTLSAARLAPTAPQLEIPLD